MVFCLFITSLLRADERMLQDGYRQTSLCSLFELTPAWPFPFAHDSQFSLLGKEKYEPLLQKYVKGEQALSQLTFVTLGTGFSFLAKLTLTKAAWLIRVLRYHQPPQSSLLMKFQGKYNSLHKWRGSLVLWMCHAHYRT